MRTSLKPNWTSLVKNLSLTSKRHWTSRCWTLAQPLACQTFLRLNPQGLLRLPRRPGRRKRILIWLSWPRGPLSGSRREGGCWGDCDERKWQFTFFVEASYTSLHLCQAGVVIRWGDSCDFVICFPFLDTIYQCFNKACGFLLGTTSISAAEFVGPPKSLNLQLAFLSSKLR